MNTCAGSPPPPSRALDADGNTHTSYQVGPTSRSPRDCVRNSDTRRRGGLRLLLELVQDDRVPLRVEDDRHPADRGVDHLVLELNTLPLQALDQRVEVLDLERDAPA